MVIIISLLLATATILNSDTLGLWRPSPYGSSTLAIQQAVTQLDGFKHVNIPIPRGKHKAITILTWIRMSNYNGTGHMTTSSFIQPLEIKRNNPDLAEGLWGWKSGVDLDAEGNAIVLSEWEWQKYDNVPPSISNDWPRGVYTVNGDCTDYVTITLGGNDYTFPPGKFNRNILPGEDNTVVLSGSGIAKVGISLTPCLAHFGTTDGVIEGSVLSNESIITDEWKLAVWRWSARGDQGFHAISNLGDKGDWKTTGIPQSSDLYCPDFDSKGTYQIGLVGLDHVGGVYDLEFFDLRVIPWWLSDSEIDVIHADGVIELNKRYPN